jgi:3-hydroxyacyl-CoA dehydrogenase/enoyl-CoA hydratase/3-hydroxybutyryl-CoA epimerase
VSVADRALLLYSNGIKQPKNKINLLVGGKVFMSNAFNLEILEQNIGLLTFDLPNEKVNKFSTPVVEEFDALLSDLQTRSDLKCLLIQSGKKGIFIAGADIKEIVDIYDPEAGYRVSRLGQGVFTKITALPFPTIAVINGACMGGGTEMSLACTYRLATDHPKTKIALPEVNIGIFPGWGGTQRLPRLIGLQRSLDVILTGRNLDGLRAYRYGIVDKVIPKELVKEASLNFALDVVNGKNVLERSRRKQKGLFPFILEKNPAGRALVFRLAKKSVIKKTKGFYPAPLEALKAVKRGYRRSLKKGLEIEAKIFGNLIGSPISKNLIKIFFWTEAVKKENGTGQPEIQPLPVKKAASLGAGVMGGGIAQLFAGREFPVRVKDINYEAVSKAYQQAAQVLKGQLKRRRITRLEFDRILNRITGTVDYSGFKNVDFIVEAIVENLEIKKNVFSELETYVRDDTIIVSNTSSLRIDDMADAFKHPHRFAGMHFFNPVHRMPLVEVIRGKDSSSETIVTTFQLAKKLGKTPVVVGDGPGFLVNRLLVPYMVEAISLLEEGHPIETIDRVMEEFGMPMGPIELFDEVGIDVASKVAKILAESMKDRMAESDLLDNMVQNNRLGKKNGLGFYGYEGKKKISDPAVTSFITVKERTKLDSEKIIARMIYPMINEAARCLDEKIAFRPQDVDLGMIFGTGFAPFRGGLLTYADDEGLTKVYDVLSGFADSYGERFTPSAAFTNIQKSGKGIYEYYNN